MPMKAKNLLSGCLAVFALFLSACSKPTAAFSDIVSTSSERPVSSSIETKAGPVCVSTSVYAVTDVSGRTVTNSDGQVVTSIGTVSPGTVPGSASATSRFAGSNSSRQPQDHTTAGGSSVESASDGQAGSTTASRTGATPMTGSETTTTTRATTTTTTRKPTETVTQSEPSDPWRYPYDLQQIYAECKREIKRLGMVWEEGLRPDSLGVSWDNPENTVVYTYFPEDFRLKDYIFNELLPFYTKQPYIRQSCRIWLEPYKESPGDYLIYFLERR